MEKLFKTKKQYIKFFNMINNDIENWVNNYHKLKILHIGNVKDKFDYIDIDYDMVSENGITYRVIEQYNYHPDEIETYTIPLNELLMNENELITHFQNEKNKLERRNKIQDAWDKRKENNRLIELEKKNKEKRFQMYLELQNEFNDK